ncbi:MAG: IS1182 family transposase, partial [Dehalococcoidia bacterium]
MALRLGNREQMQMLPPSIEQYIPEDAPVRVYDAFGDTLDLKALGIEYAPDREGNPAYDPRSMLKLLIYAYSYGVRSSRKIERETHYNLSFIWLMGGLKPDHKTIAEYRRNNQDGLQKSLKQCARLCYKLNLIEGNILFLDRTKIRGNSALKHTWNKEKCQKILAQADQRIEETLRAAEAEDAAEEGEPSLVSIATQLLEPNRIKEKVTSIMAELKESGKSSVNTTDKESASFNGIHGAGSGYNAQVVVDDKYGLIVSADAVSAGNDIGQMSGQIDQAQEVLGKKPAVAVADAGYSDISDLKHLDEQNIQLIVPNKEQVKEKPFNEFDKRNFNYDAEKDRYLCPQGHTLRFIQVIQKTKNRLYTIQKSSYCLHCQYFGKCTHSKSGRKLERLPEEDLKRKLEQFYVLPENKDIYKRRQTKSEPVFGHFKKNLGMNFFLLRGRAGAGAETSLLSICFNIRRMITILGQH